MIFVIPKLISKLKDTTEHRVAPTNKSTIYFISLQEVFTATIRNKPLPFFFFFFGNVFPCFSVLKHRRIIKTSFVVPERHRRYNMKSIMLVSKKASLVFMKLLPKFHISCCLRKKKFVVQKYDFVTIY